MDSGQQVVDCGQLKDTSPAHIYFHHLDGGEVTQEVIVQTRYPTWQSGGPAKNIGSLYFVGQSLDHHQMWHFGLSSKEHFTRHWGQFFL